MTAEELQKLVEQVSLQYFGRPFTHKVTTNQRMTTTGGRYHLQDHHLEINAHFLASQYRAELIGIIKHELTHYHLHLTRQGFRHRNRDFKALLKQVGGSRYTPDIGLNRRQSPRYSYTCQKCGQTFWRVRHIDVHHYACGKCGGKLKYSHQLTCNSKP